MKTIALLITIIILQPANAQQTCKTYIPDQWPDSRYTIDDVSGDNVVTDNQTGLMWKQCPQGLTGLTCVTGSVTTHTWQQALDLASTEDFAGFTDWRVPNQKELRTIVARNCYVPSINANVFPNTPSNRFWSSSPIADYGNGAWVVGFSYGFDALDNRGNDFRVRLVRSLGQ
jgi:hypothetical protein